MMDTVSAFRQVIERAGLHPPAVITPGEMIRFPGVGKSNGNTSGWAKLFADGQAGAYGDWSTGLSDTWHAQRDHAMTAAERAAHTRRVAELRRIRQEEEANQHAEAAQRASMIWEAASAAENWHPYLKRKGVQSHGLRVDDENRLLVPVTIDGALSSLQFIDANGGKQFLPGGKVRGGIFTLGDLTDVSIIAVCEGYATAASLHEATGAPTVCAFNAGNLNAAALFLRRHHPEAVIVVAGDNDLHDDGTPNTGLRAATAAAEAIGGVLVMPDLDGQKCDWNDVHVQRGLDAVKEAITTALKPMRDPEVLAGTTRPDLDREEELARLATLSPADYGRARKAASARFAIPLTFLDKEWESRRAQASHTGDDGRGHAIEFTDILPAFEVVDGADLGDRLADLFARFAVLPNHGAIVLALWTIFTYCLDLFQIAPRLDLSSPEKRCGKTTVLSLLRGVVFRAVLASNITPAAIFRVIAAHKPTLLIDELDTFIEANEELRGILNSGHTRDAATIIRCDGEPPEPKLFSTWAAMVFAHIGKIPDTLEDRSVRLPMRRKFPGERVASLRQTGPAAVALQEELSTLRRQIARWIADHSAHIASTHPSPVEGLSDRAVDNWMPLLSIAEAFGGTWPEQARQAAKALSGHAAIDHDSVKVELLTDIRDVYARQGVDRLSSTDLCALLVLLEERPWGTWTHGKPMTPVQLARLLKPFGVASRTIRLEGQGTPRGYLVEDFSDAFTRYISSPSPDSTLSKCNSATIRSQSGDHPLFQGATDASCCTSENGLNPAPRAACCTVADRNGVSEGEETIEEEIDAH